MANKQTQWSRAFNEKAYDRLAITIPKGKKAALESHATSKGKSINGLVNDLIREDMGIPAEDWKGQK